ncbi:hypothetical protein ABZY01_02055, partial [Streptomyces anthocyanicus]
TGKLVRRVRRGAVRKRACKWQVPRRAAYPTNRLKGFRAVATRYEKRAYIYLGTVALAALMVWLRT